MISSKEISVVVQGAIDKIETPKCLESIRKYLPGAEIILSTWEGSDLTELDYDILVLSKDPGAVPINNNNSCNTIIYNNMNRQLLSTQEGLKKCSRRYTLKLRSDLILTSMKFIDYFDKFQKRIEEYKLFQRKIVTSTLFTRHSIKTKGKNSVLIPFHISDWWFFGLTEDLREYFINIPFAKEPEFTYYFNQPENIYKKNPYETANFKFAPEQYYAYECFSKKFKDIYMEDASDINDNLMTIFEKCLVNNFIVLEFKQSGIYLNKYIFSKNEIMSGVQYLGMYSFYRYEKTYKNICENKYKVTTDGYMFENESYGYDLVRLYKHILGLISPKTKLLKKIEHFFLGIPNALIIFLVKHYKEFLVKNKI